MKKHIALILTILTFCTNTGLCVKAENDTSKFDDASVIVAMKPLNGAISPFSAVSPFYGLGIDEIENLDNPSKSISLLGLSQEKQVLKLTLSEAGTENVLETINKLNELPTVEYAEPNYIYKIADLPNDEYYIGVDDIKQYGLDRMSAPDVWDLDIDCSEVAVAVIDTGVWTSHPDLKDNIWTNPGEIPNDGKDNDGNGYIDDVHGWDFVDNDNNPMDAQGHGTHVAGTVSAVTNNTIGVASIARNAKIVPLRAGDANGYLSSDNIYKSIQYVKKMGFPIVNNSYGDQIYSQTIYNAIKECTDSLFLVSACNYATDNDVKPYYPACYDLSNIITIAATDTDDNLWKDTDNGSNYGVKSVDIAAPGKRIWSTHIALNAYNAAYQRMSGTSMACPMAASAAAVVKAKHPQMTPEEIIAKLESSGDVLDSLNGKIKTGARINAYKAVLLNAESISLDKTSAVLYKGNTLTLTAEPYPSDTTDTVSWQSSDAATVSVADGVITAIKVGSATITAECGSVSASCEITVLEPTPEPTASPSPEPTASPSPEPTASPSPEPTASPSPSPEPTMSPSPEPTASPSLKPTRAPTESPSLKPTVSPTSIPTESPTMAPTASPSPKPTVSPSSEPTVSPSPEPTASPSSEPTASPSLIPTESPTMAPTASPSPEPAMSPSPEPTASPTSIPTEPPTMAPIESPSPEPTGTGVTVEYDADSNTLSLKSASAETDKATVIQAAYDTDGKVINVKLYTVDFSGGNLSAKIDNIKISENEKIFVWQSVSDDSKISMIPLSDVFTLTVQSNS